MAHIIVRPRQTKSGLKWTATQAEWDDSKGYSVEKALTPTVLADLGFSDNMTPAQARAHAKKLNALDKVKRKEQREKVRASERLYDLSIVEGSLIPEELSSLFVSYMQENWFGGSYNLRKQVFHWKKAQKILTRVNLQPHEYFKRKNELYNEFKRLKCSKSYVEKLLRVVNMWGEFYAEQTKTFFKKVPNPCGIVLENIKNASKASGKGADPMTPEILTGMRGKLPPGQWEYLRACLWFGLRPSELDDIMADRKQYMQTYIQDGTRIVGVYQSKLVSVSKEQRWKYIPVLHPEQQQALLDINKGNLSKPLVKTVRKASTSPGNLGLYSGRKGFTDLMLSLEQDLEDISQWMGHASIDRTWKHYKNKRRVHFNKIEKHN